MKSVTRPPLFWVLAFLLCLELVAVSTIAAVLVIDLVIATPTSMATALALTVVVLLAVAWMAATVVGLFRGQAWIRASAITWQVLQFAIGLGALQGEWAQPAWGWPILVVAVVTFLLMFSRDVINATATRAAND